jgi:thioesterase domain-containing protein/acyl carrier protein
MTQIAHQNLVERFSALSDDKKKLLALRLGQLSTRKASPPGTKLVAFIVSEQSISPVQVQQHMQSALPQYMLPSKIVSLQAFPRTPNGKLDRAALIQSAFTQPNTRPFRISVQHNEDEVVKRLTEIWRSLLGIDTIAPDANFFDLGGHSLLAVRMLAQVKSAFGHDIPVSLIIEAPSIAKLAAYVREASPKAHTNTIVPLQPKGDVPPVYFLPLHIHGALHYRHLITHLGQERPLYGLPGFKVVRDDGSLPTVEELAVAYVEDLLAFQPKGPYYLCGTSIAGLLAYEIGRQFYERGIEDVKVILLDTYGPGYPQRLPLHRALTQMLFSPHRAETPVLTRLSDTGIDWLQRTLVAWKTRRSQRKALNSQAGDDHDPNHDSAVINERLAVMTSAYFAQLRPYRGQVILYRAQRQPWNAQYDHTLGWQKLVNTPVQVIHVGGEHLSILKRYHARNLVFRFRLMLGEFDKNSS